MYENFVGGWVAQYGGVGASVSVNLGGTPL